MSARSVTLLNLAILSLALSALLTPFALARRDAPAPAGLVPRAELVVFEIEGCGYCELFRRDVLPGYRRSPRHAETPIRFVDVRRTDLGAWPLAAPVTIVPTAVFMRDGREVGRLSGYAGPETFFQSLRHLAIGAAD